MSSRKERFKTFSRRTGTCGGIDELRHRRREDEIVIRKEKRDWILNSKRFRYDEPTDEISEQEVIAATQDLLKGCDKCIEKLQLLRRAFSQGSLYIDAFFSVENVLPCLVGLFTGPDPDVQLEAAWCLTNLSAGMHHYTTAIVKIAAPYLITYLSSNNHFLQDQSAWAVGNLAGDSKECQDLLHTQGAVSPLINLLQSPVPSVVQSASFALSNLARENPSIQRTMLDNNILSNIIPFLHIHFNSFDILCELGWVLTYLTASSEYVDELVAIGLLTRLLNLLDNYAAEEQNNGQVITPLLRAVGNICAGQDEYSVQAANDPDFFSSLNAFLHSKHRHIIKETLWVLSNMAAIADVSMRILHSDLLSSVTKLLVSTFDIRIEVVYLLCNLGSHSSSHCSILAPLKIIPQMVVMLKSSDLESLSLALFFCEMMCRLTDEGQQQFEECGGIGYLEGLEYHSNEAIQTQANEMLETYFFLGDENVDQELDEFQQH
ncbi:importin subunit alpha-9-like [Octopus sinensis]|uniref:Importin subunit alpha n=1 Tax=Octopus sinensis TaxID=2607531 RepID=A0A6P7SY83_9MOLL|nr:importin subunit alpha-9-like [Octopus sinensis]